VSDVSRFVSRSCVRHSARPLPLRQTRLVIENHLRVLTGLRPMERQTLEPKSQTRLLLCYRLLEF
jgi:hypothetical protein